MNSKDQSIQELEARLPEIKTRIQELEARLPKIKTQREYVAVLKQIKYYKSHRGNELAHARRYFKLIYEDNDRATLAWRIALEFVQAFMPEIVNHQTEAGPALRP